MVKQVEDWTLLKPESFIGLSTDTKPVVDIMGVTLRPSATFWELDTKVASIFDGISTWYLT